MAEAIKPITLDEMGDVGKSGPQADKTKMAQKAVDEFINSGEAACEVDWQKIDPDFDAAKKTLSYRIQHTKQLGVEGSADIVMRSKRSKGKVYMVHENEM